MFRKSNSFLSNSITSSNNQNKNVSYPNKIIQCFSKDFAKSSNYCSKYNFSFITFNQAMTNKMICKLHQWDKNNHHWWKNFKKWLKISSHWTLWLVSKRLKSKIYKLLVIIYKKKWMKKIKWLLKKITLYKRPKLTLKTRKSK